MAFHFSGELQTSHSAVESINGTIWHSTQALRAIRPAGRKLSANTLGGVALNLAKLRNLSIIEGILAASILLAVTMETSVACAQSSDNPIGLAVADTRRSEADRERDSISKPIAVLSFFDVKPGMHVLDLLSGGGYYSEILSYAVGQSGGVVAHTNDIYDEYHRDEIAKRYRDNRLPNVKRLSSNPPDLKLGSEVFDLVLLVMVYHDVYYESESNPRHPKIDRNRFFAEIRRCLKPGGTLAIVDHSAMPGTGATAAQELHRIDQEFAKKDVETAGFIFDGESNVLRNSKDDRSMLVFDDRVRGKTDRFVFRFLKPKDRK
ncbi:MAG: class I SAM-dependent methyltransferase [Deltaproteobacteria bacterium]|nr:class I SAM-dependent methyltransferase [Deltaproteobacteria bacterium]